MPVTTRASVVAMVPSLGAIGEDDPRWGLFIQDAEREMAAGVWGGLLEVGARNLVAHKMLTSQSGGAQGRGDVQSQSVGGVSITYAAAQGAPGDYARTPYGAEYRRLQRIVGGGPAR